MEKSVYDEIENIKSATQTGDSAMARLSYSRIVHALASPVSFRFMRYADDRTRGLLLVCFHSFREQSLFDALSNIRSVELSDMEETIDPKTNQMWRKAYQDAVAYLYHKHPERLIELWVLLCIGAPRLCVPTWQWQWRHNRRENFFYGNQKCTYVHIWHTIMKCMDWTYWCVASTWTHTWLSIKQDSIPAYRRFRLSYRLSHSLSTLITSLTSRHAAFYWCLFCGYSAQCFTSFNEDLELALERFLLIGGLNRDSTSLLRLWSYILHRTSVLRSLKLT